MCLRDGHSRGSGDTDSPLANLQQVNVVDRDFAVILVGGGQTGTTDTVQLSQARRFAATRSPPLRPPSASVARRRGLPFEERASASASRVPPGSTPTRERAECPVVTS